MLLYSLISTIAARYGIIAELASKIGFRNTKIVLQEETYDIRSELLENLQ
jgi:hypothetical protein